MQENFIERKSNKNENNQEVVDLVNSLVHDKLFSKESGERLISKIKSNEVGFDEIRFEIVALCRKRLDALEKIKEDPSLRDTEKEEIQNLHKFVNEAIEELSQI